MKETCGVPIIVDFYERKRGVFTNSNPLNLLRQNIFWCAMTEDLVVFFDRIPSDLVGYNIYWSFRVGGLQIVYGSFRPSSLEDPVFMVEDL